MQSHGTGAAQSAAYTNRIEKEPVAEIPAMLDLIADRFENLSGCVGELERRLEIILSPAEEKEPEQGAVVTVRTPPGMKRTELGSRLESIAVGLERIARRVAQISGRAGL